MRLFHIHSGSLSAKMPFAFYIDFFDGYGKKLRTERGIVWAYYQEQAEDIVQRRLASGKCEITVRSISLKDELTVI